MEAEPAEPQQAASAPANPSAPAAADAADAGAGAAPAGDGQAAMDVAAAPDGGAVPNGAAAGGAAAGAKRAKRKVAMHLAYLGAGFHGMQRNPGTRTIESELEGALVRAGAISEANAGSFQKIHWNRAARTDKGVSAVCQVVSAKLVVEPKEGFAARVNEHLPAQVRVFGVQRATEGFDARKFCDKRRYEYVLPAWVFDPQACARGRPEGQQAAGRRAGAAAASKASSAARLADEAAALAAIAAAVMAAPAAPSTAATAAAAADGGGDADGADGDAAAAAGPDDTGDGGQQQAAGGRSAAERVVDELASTSGVGGDEIHRLRHEIAASRQRFVFGEQQLARLNALLARYEGSHNYHNYTVRMPATDPAAHRYMLSVSADTFSIGGQPWVRIVLVGQSFMLHQIRKMVGTVLAIMRGVAPEECLTLALDPDRDVLTPMAPELGLFLDETYYDAYNTRFGELHGPVTFEPYRQAAAEFKAAILYPHIADLDDRELVNALWLRGCTEAQFKFSRWATWPKARQGTVTLHVHNPNKQPGRRRDGDNKRKQQEQQQQGNGAAAAAAGAGAAAAAAAPPDTEGAKDGQQAQQAQARKQQRLERPGKHAGASAAMVLGGQETYGMHPHSDTPKAAAARAELKAMREEHAKVMEQQQAQQQQAAEAEAAAAAAAKLAAEADAELEALYA